METIKNLNGSSLSVSLKGRLDTNTAPNLEKVIENELNGITSLIYDFDELDYVSSAGLRLILLSQKIMNKQGSMVIKNVNDDIKEIFEMTGFIDILTLE